MIKVYLSTNHNGSKKTPNRVFIIERGPWENAPRDCRVFANTILKKIIRLSLAKDTDNYPHPLS